MYSRMDLATRDRYRLELSRIASQAHLSEEEVAKADSANGPSKRVTRGDDSDPRTLHVGYYLVGPGAQRVPAQRGLQAFAGRFPRDLTERYPERILCRRRGSC